MLDYLISMVAGFWIGICGILYVAFFWIEEIWDLPTSKAESASAAHSRLQQLVQRIIEEALHLPAFLDYSGLPRDNQGRLPEFNPNTYEDLLATAILNKVIDRYQQDLKRSTGASSSGVHSGSSSPGGGIETRSGARRRGRTRGTHGPAGSSSPEPSSLEPVSHDEYGHSDSSGRATDGHTKEKHSLHSASSTDDEELYTKSYSNPVDGALANINFQKKSRVVFPEFGGDIVEINGLELELEGHENKDAQNNGNLMPNSEIYTNNNSWEENWLFQKKKIKNSQSVPVPMLIPNSNTEYRALIGDRDADDTTDLSEAGSEAEDKLEDTTDIKKVLVNSKTIIGGKNADIVIALTNPDVNENDIIETIDTNTENILDIEPNLMKQNISHTDNDFLICQTPNSPQETEENDFSTVQEQDINNSEENNNYKNTQDQDYRKLLETYYPNTVTITPQNNNIEKSDDSQKNLQDIQSLEHIQKHDSVKQSKLNSNDTKPFDKNYDSHSSYDDSEFYSVYDSENLGALNNCESKPNGDILNKNISLCDYKCETSPLTNGINDKELNNTNITLDCETQSDDNISKANKCITETLSCEEESTNTKTNDSSLGCTPIESNESPLHEVTLIDECHTQNAEINEITDNSLFNVHETTFIDLGKDSNDPPKETKYSDPEIGIELHTSNLDSAPNVQQEFLEGLNKCEINEDSDKINLNNEFSCSDQEIVVTESINEATNLDVQNNQGDKLDSIDEHQQEGEYIEAISIPVQRHMDSLKRQHNVPLQQKVLINFEDNEPPPLPITKLPNKLELNTNEEIAMPIHLPVTTACTDNNILDDDDDIQFTQNGKPYKSEEIHQEDIQLYDEVDSSQNEIPGSIAEREHKKWLNAVPMQNNPYSPEAIQRRLDKQNKSSIFDITTKRANSPSADQQPKGLPLQVVLGERTSEYKRYGRDYYINEAKRAAGARKRLSDMKYESEPNDKSSTDYSNRILNRSASEIPTASWNYVDDPKENGEETQVINETEIPLTSQPDVYSAKPVIIDDVEDHNAEDIYEKAYKYEDNDHDVYVLPINLDDDNTKLIELTNGIIITNESLEHSDSISSVDDSPRVYNIPSGKITSSTKNIQSDQSNYIHNNMELQKNTQNLNKTRDFLNVELKRNNINKSWKSTGDVYLESQIGKASQTKELKIEDNLELPSVKDLAKKFISSETTESTIIKPMRKTSREVLERNIMTKTLSSSQSSLKQPQHKHSLTARSISKEFREELKLSMPVNTNTHPGGSKHIPNGAVNPTMETRPASPVPEPGSLRNKLEFFEKLNKNKNN